MTLRFGGGFGIPKLIRYTRRPSYKNTALAPKAQLTVSVKNVAARKKPASHFASGKGCVFLVPR